MNRESSGQVALLVDYENFNFPISNDISSSDISQAEQLIAFAKEYGHIVISKAYANWNHKDRSRHQLSLYNCGIEIVQVISQSKKNSVDIKLAVDAVEMIRSQPHINVFIIASSDKDFIHVYKLLRAQGKMVVVISSHYHINPINEILVKYCDRLVVYKNKHYIPYENIADTSKKSTVSPGKKSPVGPGKKSPVGPGKQSPVGPGKKSPVGPGKKSPVGPGKQSPAGPGKKSPVGPGKQSPAGPGKKSTVGPGKKSTVGPGKKSTVGPGQKSTAGVSQESITDLTLVKKAIKEIMPEYPYGVFASEVKGLLCEKLSTNFDEKKYGYKGFEQLLNALKDVVEIKKIPDNKELLVYSSDSAVKGLDISTLMMIQEITKNLLHFIPHAERRHNALKIIFTAIKQQQPFRWEEVLERVEKMEKTVSINHDYVSNVLDDIFFGYGFYWESSQNHLPYRKREISLREDIDTEDAFVRIYEQRIAFLLRRRVVDKQKLSASILVTILNLPEDADNLAYCQSLLDASVTVDSAVLVKKLIYKIPQFEKSADKRHNILKLIYAAIKQQQPFCFQEISERVTKMEAEDISNHTVHDYLLKILNEKGFSWAKHQKDVASSDRMMSLQEEVDSEVAFIRIYEQHIVLNLRKLLSDEQQLSAFLLAEILGLPNDEAELAYCQSLLAALD